MHAFRFTQACEEYEMGLNVMLKAARGKFLQFLSFTHLHHLAEANPAKIKILHDVVKKHSLRLLPTHFSPIRSLII